MKAITTQTLRPGQTLAKPVMNHNGIVMLREGTHLTDHYIERLRRMGIHNIYVEEDAPGPAPGKEHAELNPEGQPHPPSITDSRLVAEQALTDLINNPLARQHLSAPKLEDRFLEQYRDIIVKLSEQSFVKERLAMMHLKAPFLLDHAINVATLSAIIGFANKYTGKQMYELTLAAMLYDIGMLSLSENLLTKRGKLSAEDRERIQQHTIAGYQMLANRPGIPESAALAALQHHERYNGSGYPYGSRHTDIHQFAEIIAIADTYDALVSERYHRHSYARGDAIEFLLGSGDHLFNLSLVKLFVKHISIYPIGSLVKLNSGQAGIITSIDPSFVQRPVVKITQESDGSHVQRPYEIDLKTQLQLVIVEMAV